MRPSVLFHATTPAKARRYRESGRIIAPVRGFTTLQAAMAWAIKVGRTVVYEVRCDAAAVPDLPPHVAQAIWDMDARAYGKNEPDALNDLDVHRVLTSKVKAIGSCAAAARAWGISKQTVHDALSGKLTTCPPAILKHLGLKRIPAGRTLYREI